MEIKIPEPSAKQKLFLLDKHKHVAFGGPLLYKQGP